MHHWSWPVQPSDDRALELLPDLSVRHEFEMGGEWKREVVEAAAEIKNHGRDSAKQGGKRRNAGKQPARFVRKYFRRCLALGFRKLGNVVDHQLPSAVHFYVYISEQPGCVEEFAFIFQDRSAMARHDDSVPETICRHAVVREGFEMKVAR